ncbi:hypothetical protein E2C01_055817 [Portunus trituberculatus]|uniref:PiggyBac transposable element-derived protein 4 n=1 Tax=Portunus trituberculatus TaxID=210409 RepID=A0A5B7GSA4_PORTR|nr:hypothetical protein [Portunus trituberculatus]
MKTTLSVTKESGPKVPNHVGRRLMNQQAELENHHTYNSDDEIDAWTEEKDQMGTMKVAQDEAVLDNMMVVPGTSSSNSVHQTPRRGVVDLPISLEGVMLRHHNPQSEVAWRLYRKVGMVMGIKDNEKMPLLSFIRSCVEMTIMLHGASNTSCIHTLTALSPSTLADVRRDSGNHIVIKTPEKKNVCKHCKSRTLYRCRRCNVGLHPDCFEAYHQ